MWSFPFWSRLFFRVWEVDDYDWMMSSIGATFPLKGSTDGELRILNFICVTATIKFSHFHQLKVLEALISYFCAAKMHKELH